MNRYKTSAELKNIAKDKLEGKYGTVILVVFLSEMISLSAFYLTAMLTPVGGFAALIISMIVSLVVAAVVGVLNAGICYFFLSAACGRPFTISDLFRGFREQPNKCLVISSVFALIQFVCLTPYQALSSLALADPSDTSWLWFTLLAGIVGNLIYVPLSLSISQAFYLIWDFPELTARETLRKSTQIMKGHKGRLFYIELGFLPLMLLSLFTCCVGFLWVLPYMHMTMACFFLDLMNPAKKQD